jgi:hypothetical protein
LTAKSNAPNLVHVVDDQDDKKKEFLNEIAYRLLERGEFRWGIHYKDISEIKSQQDL